MYSNWGCTFGESFWQSCEDNGIRTHSNETTQAEGVSYKHGQGQKKIGTEVDVKPETVTEENVAPAVEAPKEEAPKIEAVQDDTVKAEEAPKEEASKEDQKLESPSEKK